MGWPVGNQLGRATSYDRKTLDHLATTRQTMLDRRYNGYDQHNDPEVYTHAAHEHDDHDDHDDRHDANEHLANEHFYFHGGTPHTNDTTDHTTADHGALTATLTHHRHRRRGGDPSARCL